MSCKPAERYKSSAAAPEPNARPAVGMIMMTQDTNTPAPPTRLYDDKRLLNHTATPASWESRRANKIRERYPVTDAIPGALLVAPVQPSVRAPHSLGIRF